jgi:hypothetical protein
MRKTLSAIRGFDWRSAVFATWVFLAILGAIALGAWFANPLRWLALAASLLAVAAGWCITFKLTQAILSYRAAQAKKIRKTESPVRKSTRTVLPAPTVICDVNDALVNLGYTEKTAQQAIIAVGPSATDFDGLLRATLKILAGETLRKASLVGGAM